MKVKVMPSVAFFNLKVIAEEATVLRFHFLIYCKSYLPIQCVLHIENMYFIFAHKIIKKEKKREIKCKSSSTFNHFLQFSSNLPLDMLDWLLDNLANYFLA